MPRGELRPDGPRFVKCKCLFYPLGDWQPPHISFPPRVQMGVCGDLQLLEVNDTTGIVECIQGFP
jgi:hypothetical protein